MVTFVAATTTGGPSVVSITVLSRTVQFVPVQLHVQFVPVQLHSLE
jgi:hypothetical protein